MHQALDAHQINGGCGDTTRPTAFAWYGAQTRLAVSVAATDPPGEDKIDLHQRGRSDRKLELEARR